MRQGFTRLHCIMHLTGTFLELLALLLLLPLLFWGLTRFTDYNSPESWRTFLAFIIPAAASLGLGLFMRSYFKNTGLDLTSSMLLCTVAWLVASALGAIPFCIAIDASYIDAYFEAMSGFTTTGITVFSGLDDMPHSILFWRSLTQWLGGIGILSFFLLAALGTEGAHYMAGAEAHKISSGRPAPGMFSTLKILWGVYTLFTVAAGVSYALAGMSIFDSVCHALTTLSTGGFSPHDASIAFYRDGFAHYKLIEYLVTFFMMLGGINFLVHFRVLTGDFKALWDNIEVRYWWRMILGFTGFIIIEHLWKTGALKQLFTSGTGVTLSDMEHIFRTTIFQVIGVLTTTGFGTEDIGSDFFPAVTRQLFLVMMVIGGCVGSTGGGFKVLRIAILNKLMKRELFRIRNSSKTISPLVIDHKPVSDDEIHRVGGLFFIWIVFLIVGGAITALFSSHGPWESLSGMFSAVGNIGPCYMSVNEMIEIDPVVKITYIIGMLAGRLEIIPVLLLFSRKSWK
ncbi:MAG: TrkH family potassium uptake protein [Planctomycetota bacterium]